MRRNGWRNVDGNWVYVEKGKVVYGVKNLNGLMVKASPFRLIGYGWVYAGRIKLSAFRAGMRQNTIILM